MTLAVQPITYLITTIGGQLSYGTFQVTDTTGAKATASYPAHFLFNSSAALVNPSTEDTQLLVLNAIQALTVALENAVLSNQASLAALIGTLPTTQPSGSRQLWNDGNFLALTP